MKKSRLEIHEKYTKNVKKEIFDLVTSLNLKDDEEMEFDNSVTSSYLANGETIETTYFAITNKAFVSQCPYTGSREYTNIKTNWIHTPTLRHILKEIKTLCQKHKKESEKMS
jgi:hypothetical protein